MKKEQQLSYETEQMEMTTTTLESMFNNLGEKVKNMSVKVQFVNQQQKKAFLLCEQTVKEEDAFSFASDESDQKEVNSPESQKNNTMFLKPKEKKSKAMINQMRVIQVPFQKSILLKEKYSNKLQRIGRRLNVQFIIVPNKVKIYGMKSDLLDQASIQFGSIQDQINLEPVSHFGKQVYQSKYFKQLLHEKNVQLIKILDKYYFWFEQGTPNPKQLIKQIFMTTHHKLFYLGDGKSSRCGQRNNQAIKVAHGTFTWLNQKTSIINDLTIKIKATIFQKNIEKELNKTQRREERKVQLSEDRQSLLLHLDTAQQLLILQENIKAIYEPFRYLFLVFNKTLNINYLEEFLKTYTSFSNNGGFQKKKILERKLFFSQRIQNFVAISYFQDVNQIAETNSEIYIQQHQIMQFFKKIPQELLDFKLVLKCLIHNPDEDGDMKKFVFEKDPIQRVTYVSCKNQRRKNYQLLASLYAQKKIHQSYIKKQNEKQEISKSVSFDLSRPVDQTSIMINGSMNNSYSILKEANISSSIGNGDQKILPADIANTSQISVFRFEDYNLCFVQKPEERQKRYSEQFKIIKKRQSTLKNSQLEKAVNISTSSKFKIWGLNVPLKFKDISIQNQVQLLITKHPELQKYNKCIAVFYGGKQSKDSDLIYNEDQKIKIQKIDQKSKFKQGYILKTNLVFLYVQNLESGNSQLSFGKYEAIYYIKRLQK